MSTPNTKELETYEQRRSFGDQFLTQVRKIVGPYLLRTSPFHKDVDEATDLVLLRGQTQDVAVRIRQHKYLDRYPNDFTLRAKVRGPNQSEVKKILGGFGDLMFYGWADSKGKRLADWMLLDLNNFRHAMMGCDWRNEYQTGTKSNGDGTGLRYFNVRSLPDDVVIARKSS